MPRKKIIIQGERFIREENQRFHRICDFLGFRGINLTERKKEFGVPQLLQCNGRYYSVIHIWTYYDFNIYVADLLLICLC